MRYEEDDSPPEHTELHALAIAPQVLSVPRLTWRDASGDRDVAVSSRVIVGTAADVGLRIDDPTVSRLHAELEPRADGVWIRDLGSRNGTFINDIQISGARIPDHARLRLGAVEVRVDYGNGPGKTVEIWKDTSFGPLLGRSRPMRELFATIARVAPLDASVLLHGETGTGKELVARALHDASRRSAKPFVVVDCAALPENLLDAELFGHARGAFTGAERAREGSIEAAEGGTVFLDEIGELPMSMQPKLLRVLESRVVRRIGETSYRPVDVRFVSATHRDLPSMVSAGTFREDLYFRLSVLPLTIPPLRERKQDIPMLVSHFVRVIGGHGDEFSPPLVEALSNRPWRGNVRELRNFVERGLALGPQEALRLVSGKAITEPARESEPDVAPPPDFTTTSSHEAVFGQTYRDFRDAWRDIGEKEYVRRLLERHVGNVAQAAQEAGIDRTYVYRMIRKHSL